LSFKDLSVAAALLNKHVLRAIKSLPHIQDTAF